MAVRRDSTQPIENLGSEDEAATVVAWEPRPAASWSKDDAGLFVEVLRDHGLADKLIHKLIDFAAAPTHVKRPVDRLAIALGAQFNFFSLDDAWDLPMLLCGLAGAGTSTLAAKLAARFDESEVSVIAAGIHDPAKLEELRDKLKTLDLPLTLAPDVAALRQAVARADGRRIVIDMSGSALLDRHQIEEFANAAGAAGILVTSAEASNAETLAAAGIANALGFTRMIVTHLDAGRFLGAVLNAADTAKLALVGASITPHFGFGLRPLSPENLARRLMVAAAHAERWRVSPL